MSKTCQISCTWVTVYEPPSKDSVLGLYEKHTYSFIHNCKKIDNLVFHPKSYLEIDTYIANLDNLKTITYISYLILQEFSINEVLCKYSNDLLELPSDKMGNVEFTGYNKIQKFYLLFLRQIPLYWLRREKGRKSWM